MADVLVRWEPGRLAGGPPIEGPQVFDDHCTLRRYLVDEEFMSRTAAGVYWRAGGTVR
jgi:uncharacterized protein DUF2087